MLKNRMKQAVALLLALVLALGGIALDPTPAAAADKNVKSGDAYYTILSTKDKTAEYVKPAKKTCTSADIPKTIKISGKTYKVVSIAANAFKGCSKLEKVEIGENVKTIGKKAFYGCKKLDSIVIYTKKLTSKNVGVDAFKGINAKANVGVPTKYHAAYKKILKAKGVTGKQQIIWMSGGRYVEKYLTFDKNHPLPEPESAGFTSGNYSSSSSATIEAHPVLDTAKYTVGDTVPFTAGICLPPQIYGTWNTRTRYGAYVRCGVCGEFYESDAMLGLHRVLSECGGGNCHIGETQDYTEHYFVPDPAPCKVVYQFVLPDGLSYKEGSLKVVNFFTGEISCKNYHTEISGNKVIVVIDDIKSKPFYVPFNIKEYEKNPFVYHWTSEYESTRTPITVTFETEMNSSTAMDNTVSASITYYYKDAQKTVNFSDSSIHTASLQIKNTGSAGDSLKGATFDLYQQKSIRKEGSKYGVLNWVKVASGLTTESIVSGLGIGSRNGENRYRIVQTSVPAGYEEADYTEFELGINCSGKTTVTAKKLRGGDVSVSGGTVCVNITNVTNNTAPVEKTDSKDTGSTDIGSADTGSGSTGSGTPPTTDTDNVVEQPDDTDADDGLVRVTAVYYKDGVRSFSMTYQQDAYGGMMDSYNIYDCSDEFQGCTLQKITVDGAVVDSLPAKVREDAEVCFYYVSK